MTDGTALHVFPRRTRGAVDHAELTLITRLLDASGRTAAGAAHSTVSPARQPRGVSQGRGCGRPAHEGTT